MKRRENWEQLMLKVIEEKLDPWRIDITKLADEYLQAIKKGELGIRASGRILLAAAILLEMKAKALLINGGEEKISRSERKMEKMKRRVLLNPYLKVYTYPRLLSMLRRKIRGKEKIERDVMEKASIRGEINSYIDISRKIKGVYESLIRLAAEEILFSSLTLSKRREEKIELFVLLLFLEKEGKICLHQVGDRKDILIELR